LCCDAVGEQICGDRLRLATGSVQQAIPVVGAASHAFDVDTYAAAQRLDTPLALLLAVEPDPGQLTFVVVGAGFTDIEMGCEMRRNQTCLDLGDYGALLPRGWERIVVQAGPGTKPIQKMIHRRIIHPTSGDSDALLAAAEVP